MLSRQKGTLSLVLLASLCLISTYAQVVKPKVCLRDSYFRAQRSSIGSCNPGEDKINHFCYEKCKTGYTGIGLTCWTKNSEYSTECGLFAARSGFLCSSLKLSELGNHGQKLIAIGLNPDANQLFERTNMIKKIFTIMDAINKLKLSSKTEERDKGNDLSNCFDNPLGWVPLI